MRQIPICAVAMALLANLTAYSQSAMRTVVVPQLGAFNSNGAPKPKVEAVDAGVVIRGQSATTTLDISLRNPSPTRTEAELWIPVPSGAVVRSFTFQGASPEATARILSRAEATSIYHEITSRLKDPALLEFSGHGMVRSTVFPIEPHQGQKLRLTYEEVLPTDGGRVDYQLLKSESLAYHVPWKVSVKIKTLRPLSTAYSPTHRVDLKRDDATTMFVRTAEGSEVEPGPFRLSFLHQEQGVSSTLYASPDAAANGGYFLLLAGPPADLSQQKSAAPVSRDVTLVLDHSGSMGGDKLQQVKAAARQTISSLGEREYFNIVLYSDGVHLYSPQPVQRTAANLRSAIAFIDSIHAGGGTNIHDALAETMRLPVAAGALPVVLFLTDGLPTTGVTSEQAIRTAAASLNVHQRRVFAFGVGADVNAPMLDRISTENRGVSTYILPGETVERKVAQVFQRLTGPVLASPRIEAVTASGTPDPGRLADLLPARLPDLYEGDQLVILGRYNQDRPLTLRISGTFLGRPASFTQSFQMDRKTTRNAFVTRLWASRKIGVLVDELRQLGAGEARSVAHANMSAQAVASWRARPVVVNDPRVQELTSEILRLSTQHGILTEYTAFLATEGTDLTKRDAVMAQATAAFQQRAIETRSGLGAVNQSLNNNWQMSQVALNNRNSFLTAEMKQAETHAVQQAGDLTFFFKNGRWVDSRIYAQGRTVEPVRAIRIGTAEFAAFSREMTAEGRGAVASLKGDAIVLFRGQPVLLESK